MRYNIIGRYRTARLSVTPQALGGIQELGAIQELSVSKWVTGFAPSLSLLRIPKRFGCQGAFRL